MILRCKPRKCNQDDLFFPKVTLSTPWLTASMLERRVAPSPDCSWRPFSQRALLPFNNVPCYFTPEPCVPAHPREIWGYSHRLKGKRSIMEFLMQHVSRLETFHGWKWNNHLFHCYWQRTSKQLFKKGLYL